MSKEHSWLLLIFERWQLSVKTEDWRAAITWKTHFQIEDQCYEQDKVIKHSQLSSRQNLVACRRGILVCSYHNIA